MYDIYQMREKGTDDLPSDLEEVDEVELAKVRFVNTGMAEIHTEWQEPYRCIRCAGARGAQKDAKDAECEQAEIVEKGFVNGAPKASDRRRE